MGEKVTAYYNEFDPFAAAWLRELIKAGMIPEGDVDERDIREVQPEDLRGYTQCHFFAGIGGWAYALRLAGWPDERPVWTGSPPCQPFSTAGKRKGKDDERHLWPAFFELIRERRPDTLFGEQVEAAIRHAWLDDVQADLEREGYAVGALVLPAAGFGAPHIRQRLWFVAQRLGDCEGNGWVEAGLYVERDSEADKGSSRDRPCDASKDDGHGGVGCCGLADSQSKRRDWSKGSAGAAGRDGAENCCSDDRPSPLDSPWQDPDWLLCRDGKWRPVEAQSSIQRVADGLSGELVQGGAFVPASNPIAPASKESRRVLRLKGYGNAIVPQVAAEVIKSFVAFIESENR